MHQPGVKCVWVQAFPCRAAKQSCTSGLPSVNFVNKGPTHYPPPGGRPRGHNFSRPVTNVNQNITEATEAAPILCQDIPQIIFYPDAPVFSPNFLIYRAGWPTLLDSARAAHTANALTKTAASDTATLAAIGSGKINSNRSLPIEGPDATPRLPANPGGDITLEASSGGSYGNV